MDVGGRQTHFGEVEEHSVDVDERANEHAITEPCELGKSSQILFDRYARGLFGREYFFGKCVVARRGHVKDLLENISDTVDHAVRLTEFRKH